MSKPQRKQRILARVPVATRDGVALCTDVFLDADDEPTATVVVRTPYGRNIPTLLRMAQRLTQSGLCVVLQDCRGRYQSKGEYDWSREIEDTEDTLRWIVEQPFSNGRVGLCGMSVTANPNCFVAANPPANVRVGAMVSIMGSISHHATVYSGGALTLHWALPWSVMMDPKQMGRTTWQKLPWREIFRRAPLQRATDGHLDMPIYWARLIAAAAEDETWAKFDARPLLSQHDVPTLYLSGWGDFMLKQTLDAFQTMSSARPPHAQQLIVGNWDHTTLFESFGAQAGAAKPAGRTGAIDLLEVVADFYARHLREVPPSPPAERPPVVLSLLEDGRWLGFSSYPPVEAEIVDWYLASSGRAGTDLQDGRLVREPPTEAHHDAFAYDPESPVPTTGGALWQFAAGGIVGGPLDQAAVEERPDVLVYTTEPLEDDVHVIGPVRVELWASSSARDTDFTAKLVDVDEFGVPRIVQDGIVRARFRRSPSVEELLEPNRPTLFSIGIPDIARRFLRGHRLRIEISSSNFPKFDRNLNTAQPNVEAAASAIAQQVVFHGGEMASRLRLSVVPAGRIGSADVDGDRGAR